MVLYNGWSCICGCQGSFYHRNGSILTLWEWLNDEKQFFRWKFSYVNNHLFSVINFNHVKLRYMEPCNFLTKRALVSQPSTIVVAKDPNISHYLNLSIYLPTIRLSLPLYDTHPTWLSLTNELQFVDLRHQINSLSLVNLLLLINKFSFICEGQSCRIRITSLSLQAHTTRFWISFEIFNAKLNLWERLMMYLWGVLWDI